MLSVQVYVTGTPYRSFTVQKDRYISYTGSITTTPAKGQTVDLYATLNPQPAAPAMPAPTEKSPLPLVITLFAIAIAGLCGAGIGKKLH